MHICPTVKVNSARKNHTCTWCGQRILKGSSYVKWFYADGRYSLDNSETKCHPECKDAWDKLQAIDPWLAENIEFGSWPRGRLYINSPLSNDDGSEVVW